MLAVALPGCDFAQRQSIFEAQGPIAQQQIGLLYWTFWLSLIVIFGVGGVLFYSIIRFRRRAGDDSIPAQTHGNAIVEISLILIATIIVVLVAIPTMRVNFAIGVRPELTEDDIHVKVTGYQWWWAFEYPELGIVTANELYIPRGRRVVLDLRSGDVLHGFWVPRLAGKMDLIPNQDNRMWLITDENTPLGEYFGQCTQLCLGAHAYMRFRVYVVEDDEFADWTHSFQRIEPLRSTTEASVGAAPQPVQSDNPLVAQGQQLFRNKGCAACHAVKGQFGGAPDKPNLTNFGMRNWIAAGVLENTPENLARWLRDPQDVKPTNYMPTLWAADDPNREAEIEAIIAYLYSLGGESERAPQAELGGNYGN
jgi:cytochrome c oxidase subunit 2